LFGLVSKSPTHTGLISVKIPATNISRLGPFKELHLRKVLHYLSSLKEEKTFAVLIPLTLLQKQQQPLCEHKE
jgi:hypothetical protein